MQESAGESVRRLLTAELRLPIEERVAAYLGRTWQVSRTQDKTDESSHPAAILGDATFAVFVKFNEGGLAWDQLQREVAGLRLLTDRAGVLTPVVIDTIQVDAGALVIMAAVQAIQPQQQHWRAMGRALAQIHSVKGEQFGLETNGYWGSLYQDNRPLADWPEFFWTRRIEPRLRAAVDAGQLPTAFVARVERVGTQLAAHCGPTMQPALLHGDAHQNNVIHTADGPVWVDPATYYGHPEVDLAFVDFFAPVPAAFFHGYEEVTPIDPDFRERKRLWLIPAWLAMLEVDGPHYLAQLDAVLRLYSDR